MKLKCTFLQPLPFNHHEPPIGGLQMLTQCCCAATGQDELRQIYTQEIQMSRRNQEGSGPAHSRPRQGRPNFGAPLGFGHKLAMGIYGSMVTNQQMAICRVFDPQPHVLKYFTSTITTLLKSTSAVAPKTSGIGNDLPTAAWCFLVGIS